MNLNSVAALCLICSASVAQAREEVGHSTDNEWNSAEASSLGGIGWMSDNFVDVFFANPAQLALDDRPFVIQWASLNGNFTSAFRETVEDVSALQNDASSKSRGAQIIDAMDKLGDIFGRRIGAGLNLSLFATKAGHFFLVPYAIANVDAQARVPAWPRAGAIADAYAGVGLGYTMELSDELDVGVSMRPGLRYYAAGAYDVSKLGEEVTNVKSGEAPYQYGGAGYIPVDAGLVYHLNEIWNVNFSARNVGGAPSLGSIDSAPPDYLMRLALSVQCWCFEKDGHSAVFASEVQDLERAETTSRFLLRWQWAGKYRYQLSSLVALGANFGLQSGYPSFGGTLDLSFLKFVLATYTKEAGYYPNQRPERRFALGAVLETSF